MIMIIKKTAKTLKVLRTVFKSILIFFFFQYFILLKNITQLHVFIIQLIVKQLKINKKKNYITYIKEITYY